MEVSAIHAAATVIEEGTWVPSPTFKGVSHRVRGSANSDARALRESLINAVPRVERIDGLSAEKRAEIDAHVLSSAIWIDVRGLTENKAPIDIAAAKALLLDPKIGTLLRADVFAAAAMVGEDELAAGAVAEKN